jgi:hypothetical protein
MNFIPPPGTTKLAIAMATMEGYGVPGAIPTVRNNPLDLRHGPNATHPADDPDGIGYYATPELGWADGERQLRLYAERHFLLQQMIYEFAPPTENNSAEYLAFVCSDLDCSPSISVADALEIVEN